MPIIGVDESDIRIMALAKKVDELESDKQTLLKLLDDQHKTIVAAYKRDAECPYCQSKHAEIDLGGCFA